MISDLTWANHQACKNCLQRYASGEKLYCQIQSPRQPDEYQSCCFCLNTSGSETLVEGLPNTDYITNTDGGYNCLGDPSRTTIDYDSEMAAYLQEIAA
jgi:hypothetical protein